MTRRFQRVAFLLAALVAGDCVEGPTGPGSQVPARVRVELVLPPGTPDAWLPAGDTLRVLVRRAGRVEPIVDSAGVTDSLAATVTVPLDQAIERFVATAELSYRGQVLFLAFDAIQLRADLDTAVQLAAVYVGPGGGAAALTVAAADSILEAGDTTTVVPTALDSLARSLGRVPVRFRSLRPDLFTVDASGLVTALEGTPDTARVDVVMPTGLSGSLPLWLVNALSPFTQTIAFISARDGNRELYVMNGDGSGARRLTRTPEPESFAAWAPDGSAIGFERVVGDATEIFTLRLSDSTERQLTSDGSDNVRPRYSPDGTRIGFTSRRAGTAEAWIMDADGGNQRRLAAPFGDGEEMAFGDWSPDGRQVLVLQRPVGASLWTDAWVADTNGDNPRRVLSAGEGSAPNLASARWSPLGGEIVYTNRGVSGDTSVYAVDLRDRTRPTGIPNDGTFDGNPSYAAAGDALVFESNAGGVHGVYRADAGGLPLRLSPASVEEFEPDHLAPPAPIYVDRLEANPAAPALTSDEASQVFTTQAFGPRGGAVLGIAVDWESQDDRTMMIGDTAWALGVGTGRVAATYGGWRWDTVDIAITSAAGPNAQRLMVSTSAGLYTMRGDGGDTVRVLPDPFAAWPASRPDGARIALVSYESGNGEIYAVNADGSQRVNLTNDPADDTQPSWSPDGGQIVFASTRGGGSARFNDLWIMNADGTGGRRLTSWADVNVEAVDPAWSPDGSAILYVRYIRANVNPELWMISPSGLRHEEFVLPQSMGYRFPAWTPDGTAVVYTRSTNATGVVLYFGLGRAPFTPDAAETVLSTGASPRFSMGGDFYPSVADDGLIAFSRGGRPFVMRPDGTAQSALTGFGTYVRWRPEAVRSWVATVGISGDVATPIPVGGTRQLTGTALDQNGAPIAPVGGFQWIALEPAVATVDFATGLVTGVAAGNARMVVSSGIAAPDTVTVRVAGPPTPVTRTWVGGAAAGPTDWFVAGNWNPAGVPATADSVRIESAADQPVLTGSVTVARVQVTGGSLTLNGHALTVTGDFSTENGTGLLIMGQPADQLTVQGSAVFQGGVTSGLLTDGTLAVAGDFEQRNFGGNTQTFQALGNHRTVLNGSALQQLVPEGNPTFGHLEIANTGGGVSAVLETTLAVEGSFSITTPTVFNGGDNSLDVEGPVSTVAGSTLSTLELRLFTTLTVGGAFDVGLTEFAGQDQEIPDVAYRDVRVSEQARLGASVTMSGYLLVSGGSAGSSLALNGHTLTVATLTTGGGGADPAVLIMQNPSDVLIVTGDATFGGGDTEGLLTEGVLYLGGRFFHQLNRAFRATGNHRTVLNGTGPQEIWVNDPTVLFHHLEVAKSSGGVGIPLPPASEGIVLEVGGKLVLSTAVALTGADAAIDVGDSAVSVTGSAITLYGLTLRGGLALAGALDVRNIEFAGSDQTIPAQGVYQEVSVTGRARLAAALAIPGSMSIRDPQSDLTLNGHRLTVGTLSTGGVGIPSGTLTMTDPADSLVVTGDAAFFGASTAGGLTAGTLILSGGFFQGENPESFQPSSTHRTVLNGATQQIVSFTNPGATGATSRFHDLELAQSAGEVRFQTAAAVTGTLRTDPALPQRATGPGPLLSVEGVDVAGLTFDGIALAIGAGSITRLDDVTFSNQDPGAAQLSVAHAGSATPFSFDGLQFLTTPATGYYVSATDVAPGDGNVLTLNLTDAVPPDGSAFTLTSGGAVVTWAGGSPAVVYGAIEAGLSFSCGAATTNEAYCWGANGSGQLGDGTTAAHSLPALVTGGPALVSVTTGGEHACGLDAAGLAYCWGSNVYGQLGDGTTTDRLTPVAVLGGFSYSMISAGEQHTCGVQTSTGLLYCWGRNTNGQLGDGTTTDRATLGPVEGVEGLTFQSVSAAIGQHTCAVTTTGDAYCWGRNTNGQLGDGSTSDRLTPVAVSGGLTFSMVSASANEHTCGVITGGQAYCWGWNNFGALGDGTTTTRTSPTAVLGGLTFSSVSGGANGFTCGLAAGGAAYCWGLNNVGQLGDGSTTNRLSPVAVSGGLAFARIDAGFAHVVAVTGTGAGYAWGANGQGQLGDGTTTNRNVPTPLAVPPP